jgi:hypothetical protein
MTDDRKSQVRIQLPTGEAKIRAERRAHAAKLKAAHAELGRARTMLAELRGAACVIALLAIVSFATPDRVDTWLLAAIGPLIARADQPDPGEAVGYVGEDYVCEACGDPIDGEAVTFRGGTFCDECAEPMLAGAFIDPQGGRR